jgi:hypothetical protein
MYIATQKKQTKALRGMSLTHPPTHAVPGDGPDGGHGSSGGGE